MVSIQTPLPPSLNHVINAREPLPPKKREHYKTLWQTYGWNQTLDFDQMMENHPDFFHFLRDSKTLYTIRGYQHSFQKAETPLQEAEPFKQAINADMNGHPLLYKEGNWVRWEEIKQEIEYSPKRKQLVSQDNDMVEWNYLYPFGLIPQSNKSYIEPVYQLTPVELANLKKSCGATEECGHIIQVFTTEKPLLKRISHAGLRLITDEGKVYSLSFVTPDEEVTLEDGSVFNLLATYNVGITSPDFAEFDQFSHRRVTSKPVTLENFTKALNRVKEYAKTDLRFNFLHQNCGTFVADILNTAEIPIDVTCWVGKFFWEVGKDIPCIGPLIRLIDSVVNKIIQFLGYITPRFIQIPILFTVRVITYLPFKILTILRNCFLLSLGGAKAGMPLKPGIEHNWDNRERLTAFNRHINSWKDMFKDDTGKVSTTAKIVDWQLEAPKGQTHIFKYDGSPSFTIVPPA